MRKSFFANTVIPLLIFIFFFAFSLAIRFDIGTFTTQDDPYFHSRMAHSLWHGTQVAMPRYSTQYDHTSNLYFLYHAAMAPFVAGCEAKDFTCIIIGSQIFHSMVLGLFMVFIYLLFRRILMRGEVANSHLVSLVLTLLLFLISRQYMSRMLFERPIVWGLFFFSFFIYAILKKKNLWIFLVPFVFVFSYSVTVILLVPVGIYLVSGLIFGNEKPAHYFKTFGLAIAGIVTGTLLRPDTYSYILNAYGSHIVSVYQSLFSRVYISIPNEFASSVRLMNFYSTIWFWALLAFTLLCLFFALRERKDAPEKVNLIFLCVNSIFFLGLYVFFYRAIDYVFVSAFLAFCYAIARWGDQSYALRFITENKAFLSAVAIMAVLSISGILVRPLMKESEVKQNKEYYELDFSAITEAIRADYNPGDIVFIPGFGTYAKMIFYDPGITYTGGMDSSFMRLYDDQIFWKNQHATHGRKICGVPICASEDETMYEFIQGTMKAKYIFLETKNEELTPFKERVLAEPKFVKIFSFPEDGAIEIYKVN